MVRSVSHYKSTAYWSAMAGLLLIAGIVSISNLAPTLAADLFGISRYEQWIHTVLLLGVFSIVPLGLSLVPLSETENSRIFRLAVTLQPAAGLLVLLSYLFDQGVVAATLCLAWLGVTGLIALYGFDRLRDQELRRPAELALNAGLVYLPIGAMWLIASRGGIQPMGFGDTIVTLTAVHFHFAGFAAPILAGLAGRVLPTGARLHTAFAISASSIVIGTPLVAAGITASPIIALVGAVIIAAGLFGLSSLVLFWVVPRLKGLGVRILLVISSVSALPAMVLACVYAYSIVFHLLLVDIPQMAMTHGLLNSFGFALCGLVAWSAAERI